MSRGRKKVPSYGLHKASGQARIIVGGRTIYLGKYDSPESHEAYARWVARLAVAPPSRATPLKLADAGQDMTINELLVRYLHYADGYYRWKGERTKEYNSMVEAVRPLRQLYGTTRVDDFGPKALVNVRDAMIQRGLCRRTINRHVSRIRRIFAWGVAEELIAGSIAHALASVKGLRYGRSTAPESRPTQTVAQRDIEAVLPFVSPPVAAMIQVQLLGAMRPAEVTIMRPCDIDMTNPELWIYRPKSYKTEWLERPREVFLGPRCQEVLKPFLNRPDESYLFSPKEAEQFRNDERGESRDPDRKTKIYPFELRYRQKRKQAAKARRSKRPKGEHYSVSSYRRAIEYGIKQGRREGVEIAEWCPRQLRHTMATRVRDELGLEAAQVICGHAKCDVTQVYAASNRKLGIQVASKLG